MLTGPVLALKLDSGHRKNDLTLYKKNGLALLDQKQLYRCILSAKVS